MAMSDPASPLPLSVAEARVLGCLIEKQATTPDVYPLTVSAAVAGANQKTARDPLLSLQQGEVHHALRQLELKRLARQVFSSRAERYEHLAERAFALPGPQVALLAVLLLRGLQTVHELLSRSERLHAFADADDVRHHLDRLIGRETPLVVLVPRGPGQREDRYAHLLSGDVDVAAMSRASASAAGGNAGTSGTSSGHASALEARVDALEEELAQLRAQVERWMAGAAPQGNGGTDDGNDAGEHPGTAGEA